MTVLTHVDVCSGVGCFGIAAAHVGFQTAAFCEIEEYCRLVLARHFPKAYIHDDLKTLTRDTLRRFGIYRIHLFSGGFPCQDICTAGSGGGLEGKRSGLWFEQLRLIKETRPLFAVIENVAALKTRGADIVLAGLEEAGYTAGAFVVGAWAAGAPHGRERVWIVAHARSVSDAKADSTLDSLREKWDARNYDGGSRGPSLPRTGGAIPEPGMGRGSDGPPCALDGGRRAVIADSGYRELDFIRGLNHEQNSGAKSKSEIDGIVRILLCEMWVNRETAKTSPDLYAQRLYNCVPEMSHTDTCSRWFMGDWRQKDKRLLNLWQSFSATPLNQQNMQRELLERIMQTERQQTMASGLDGLRWPAAPGASRQQWEPSLAAPKTIHHDERMKACGNAIVWPVAAAIFGAIKEIM